LLLFPPSRSPSCTAPSPYYMSKIGGWTKTAAAPPLFWHFFPVFWGISSYLRSSFPIFHSILLFYEFHRRPGAHFHECQWLILTDAIFKPATFEFVFVWGFGVFWVWGVWGGVLWVFWGGFVGCWFLFFSTQPGFFEKLEFSCCVRVIDRQECFLRSWEMMLQIVYCSQHPWTISPDSPSASGT